ncbi:MAG: hypothetical protein HOJ34_12160 [Kordiimonadaceae bacterium]|jgi:hypothetical protein|nr:hypothetical protein [Kordiimonadaceae bacterium]MBT6035705.1 hypothetical protein [Kordiimonadaceae bacterium]MBT6330524.1 hypothetical protein [Kordiimonadaceae bacterium]MBT7583051.1 hypothetical protein [Kordiimonadaceae bacterium]
MTQNTATSKAGSTSWFLPVIAAASYPYLLILFSESIVNSKNVAATLAMVVMFIIPLLAIWSLRKIKNSSSANPAAQRTLLYFIVATPPFYIVSLNILGLLGLGEWHSWIWIISFIALGIVFIRKTTDQSKHSPSVIPYNNIQKIHRYSALALIVGFILLHITNHLFALQSNEMHEEYRLLFNSWYQADLVEPVLFALIATMAITGLLMVRRYSGTDGDMFRTLQIGAGVYMLFFFVAHINAILSGRDRGTETDWLFATTGEAGLIVGAPMLIPYYIFAVLMILLHISLGLRRVLLSKNIAHEKANRTFYILISVGSLVTVMIGAAILGLKI